MISPYHITLGPAFKSFGLSVLLFIFTALLSGCAATRLAPPSQFEANPNALTVPYQISEAGLMEEFGLVRAGKSVDVKGLVASAVRPLAEDVAIDIGAKRFQRGQVVILDNPSSHPGVVGLLGVDALGDYTVLFNKTKGEQAGRASFIPSAKFKSKSLRGWRKISLRNQVGSFPDNSLYFATIYLKGRPAPVLIDTGSELNFVNWELAVQDEKIEKLRRSLRKTIKLQGINESIPLRMSARLHDVHLGRKSWPYVDVTVLEFDSLNAIAPVDRPMMLAGANMFTSSTFAFDFADNALYIYTDEPDEINGLRDDEIENPHESIWGNG